jgi:putative aldouronate transport system substrate-binding protein
MKKTSFTVVAALLAIMMMIAGCSGNNGGNNSGTSPEASVEPTQTATEGADKPDISKEVKLKMYLIGDRPKDTDLVYAEINKKLKQDINATVEPVFLSWGEYEQKYPLLFATGEDFDLIFAGSWLKYSEQANKGAFKELTPELLNKYAP